MSRQRVFFAARPPAPVLSQIEQCADACVVGPSRRVATSALHLTLCFLGSLEAAQIERAAKVANDLAQAPIKLVFEHCEHRRRQQLVWLRARPNRALTDFVAALRAGLEQAGVPFDAREHLAHMTLARAAREGHCSDCEIAWCIDYFELLSSTPSAQGSVYQRLYAWPLK